MVILVMVVAVEGNPSSFEILSGPHPRNRGVEFVGIYSYRHL